MLAVEQDKMTQVLLQGNRTTGVQKFKVNRKMIQLLSLMKFLNRLEATIVSHCQRWPKLGGKNGKKQLNSTEFLKLSDVNNHYFAYNSKQTKHTMITSVNHLTNVTTVMVWEGLLGHKVVITKQTQTHYLIC